MAKKLGSLLPLIAVAVIAAIVAWLASENAMANYDYTHRIATSLLEGKLGFEYPPPPWLNEMVPFKSSHYSVFPLGAVVSVLPLSWLVKIGWLQGFPLRLLLAGLGAAITAFAFLLTGLFRVPMWKRVLFATVPLFGSCLWPNFSWGGAWQVAIGFAVAGELGALVFTLVRPMPVLAGLCFAIGFGNRTEILLTAPVFYYLLHRSAPDKWLLRFSLFSIAPFVLGVLTLAYNAARFDSPLDFGYARIPGVLDEPWYEHGIFSVTAIPYNIYYMLFDPWKWTSRYPWLVPGGWGGSIFLFSPFLFLLFRRARGDFALRAVAWSAIAILTLLLWLHGNAGGWQVSYRYAAILYPWALLILLQGEPRHHIGWSPALILAAIAINAYATWIFCFTGFMRP